MLATLRTTVFSARSQTVALGRRSFPQSSVNDQKRRQCHKPAVGDRNETANDDSDREREVRVRFAPSPTGRFLCVHDFVGNLVIAFCHYPVITFRLSASRWPSDGSLQLSLCPRQQWYIRAAYRGHRPDSHCARCRRATRHWSRMGRNPAKWRTHVRRFIRSVRAERTIGSVPFEREATDWERNGILLFLHGATTGFAAQRSGEGTPGATLRQSLPTFDTRPAGRETGTP